MVHDHAIRLNRELHQTDTVTRKVVELAKALQKQNVWPAFGDPAWWVRQVGDIAERCLGTKEGVDELKLQLNGYFVYYSNNELVKRRQAKWKKTEWEQGIVAMNMDRVKGGRHWRLYSFEELAIRLTLAEMFAPPPQAFGIRDQKPQNDRDDMWIHWYATPESRPVWVRLDVRLYQSYPAAEVCEFLRIILDLGDRELLLVGDQGPRECPLVLHVADPESSSSMWDWTRWVPSGLVSCVPGRRPQAYAQQYVERLQRDNRGPQQWCPNCAAPYVYLRATPTRYTTQFECTQRGCAFLFFANTID